MTDIRQNINYARYLEKQDWLIDEHSNTFYYIKKFLFLSAIKIQRPKKIDLKHIQKLSKKHRAIQVVIEPRTTKEARKLIKNGWQQVGPFIPSKTVVLNLAKSKKAVFSSFDKDTRYSIRKSGDINIHEEKDLESFRGQWRRAVDYKRYLLSIKQLKDLKEVFGKDSLFLVAEDGISGAIFLVAGGTGYYWYGFVNKKGRKKLSQYKIVWEGIKWAKERGVKYFDMEGIFDERFPIPTWRGFTKFKTGFGGKIEKYPGAYQKIVWSFG